MPGRPSFRRLLTVRAPSLALGLLWALSSAPAEAKGFWPELCSAWLTPYVRAFSWGPERPARIELAGKSAGFLRAYAILEAGFPGFPKRTEWLVHPGRDPRTQEWVALLVELDPAERDLLRARLIARPPRDPAFRRISMLALYDREAWHAYFSEFSTIAQLDEALISALLPVLAKMPDELTQSLYDRIGPIYDRLSKRNARWIGFTRHGPLRLAPKRAVDAFIRNTLKADEKMAVGVAEGLHPLTAYSRLIRELRTRIFAKTEQVSEYGANEVLAASLAVQDVLRAHRARFPNGEVLMTGSFPNGRAKLASSDVDCKLSDPALASLLAEFDAAVNATLRTAHPEAKLEFHTMRLTTTPNFAADINPLQIRVSEDRVELLVYGRETVLDGDARRFPFNYAEPDAYSLQATDPGAGFGPYPRGWPMFRKPALSVQAATVESKAARAAVEQAIEAGYPDLDGANRWLFDPAEAPRIQAWIENLLGLDAETRARLLARILRRPPPDGRLREITRMALYDEEAWQGYYDGIVSGPPAHRATFDALVPLFTQMPSSLRANLLRRIAEDYGRIPGRRYARRWLFWRSPREYSPKHVVGAMIRQLRPPRPAIEEAVRAGRSPFASYAGYLASLAEAFFGRKGGAGIPTASAVLEVARIAQAALKEAARNGLPKPSLTLTGDFPNGRTDVEGTVLSVVPSHYALEDLYPSVQRRANAFLAAKTETTARLTLRNLASNLTEIDVALVSPIVLRVHPDRIELVVYGNFRPIPYDREFLPANYPPPAVYVLE